jgi:hypothetical protein
MPCTLPHRVGTLDYMSPEVVSLPTADERKRMEAAGRQVMEQSYGEKVRCGLECSICPPSFELVITVAAEV